MSAKQWFTPMGAAVALGAVALIGGAVVWVRYRDAGGARQLGQDIATGALDAAGGIAGGAVGWLGETVGLTRPDALIDDVQQARELIGQFGFWRASRDTTARALFAAMREGPAYYGNEGRGR